jgi:hypothetical protein
MIGKNMALYPKCEKVNLHRHVSRKVIMTLDYANDKIWSVKTLKADKKLNKN